ncbi:uncharacterized protein znf839 isoform X1 [Leucoraja erinacea]|uniref:uncharacterized protein znf839 isoform X1 n=1 Tax=Leucoraja erinaceus TaxID=7782 RepID=UPI002453BBBC|nr:uncharacterized protein znf839 isoform X1 [Leucoraja erinacea]
MAEEEDSGLAAGERAEGGLVAVEEVAECGRPHGADPLPPPGRAATATASPRSVLPDFVRVAVEDGAARVVGGGLFNAGGLLTSMAEAEPEPPGAAGDFAVAQELDGISIETEHHPSTIIYVQPDGTLVEGTGLSPEEQQQLVEQLAKQQGLVEVSESEAAQMFGSHQQHHQHHTQFVQHVALTDELQQVIAHVTKSQQHAAQFGKTAAVQLTSASLGNQVLQKTSLTPCISTETRMLATDRSRMIQVPVCNALMPQVQTGVQPSQVVHRIDSCNPVQVQQICISTQSSTVNQPSQPKILTALSQQQHAYTQPLTIVQNAARQLQNAAHQAVLHQNLHQSIAHVQHKMAPLRVTSSTQHQLDTVQVHLQAVSAQEEKDRPMPPLAVVQPKTAASSLMANQRTVSGGINISGPQIIRIQPLSTSGSQQYILHSTSEPPIQLLVQRQPPPLAPVNSIRTIPGITISGQSGLSTGTVTTNISTTTTAVVNLVATSHAKKHESSDKSKEKKPVKIKTRSGRISRPPKYKVKDYKFIKTEDLAEGHQSDSDDYSEYSLEEEEVKTKMDDLSLSMPCSFKPKKFKCDTCEKSYIGRGGLARHYRLNPSHGQLASVSEEQRTSVNKSNGNVIGGDSGGGGDTNGTITDGLVTPSINIDTTSLMVGSTDSSSQDIQQTGKVTLAQHFPARRRTVRRGRPPKHHNNTHHQDQVIKRKARLKELLKQCDDEELMELALPRLTKVITLWEFLLMKVEKGRPARPQFQDVYREFEMLHKHVKKMAEEHLSNSIRMLNPQQPLQISSLQVAESLGITEHMNKENQQDASMALTYKLVTADDQNHNNSPAEKHVMEQDFGPLSPLSKRMKIDDSIAGTENNLNQNGIEITGEVHFESLTNATADKKQSDCPALNACDLHTVYGAPSGQVEEDNHTDALLLSGHIKSSSSIEQSAPEDLCYQVTQVNLSSTELPLLEPNNEDLNNTIQGDDFLAMDTDITAEELVQEQLSSQNISEQLNDTELNSTVDEMTNQTSLVSEMAKVSEKGSEVSNSVQDLQHNMDIQDPLGNQEQGEQLNDSDIADQMQQLEKALSRDVEPIGQVCHNSHLQHHQTEQTFETDISHQVVVESRVSTEEMNGLEVDGQSKIIGHFEDQSMDQRSQESSEDILETTVTEDGALEFQLPVGSQELLAQGHEQIFIQTSEGLIVSHEGTAVVSQTSEGIVIVTNADGTTMHIRTPDGVPFETVEALLAMDAEGQSEGLIVTQTHTEVEQ